MFGDIILCVVQPCSPHRTFSIPAPPPLNTSSTPNHCDKQKHPFTCLNTHGRVLPHPTRDPQVVHLLGSLTLGNLVYPVIWSDSITSSIIHDTDVIPATYFVRKNHIFPHSFALQASPWTLWPTSLGSHFFEVTLNKRVLPCFVHLLGQSYHHLCFLFSYIDARRRVSRSTAGARKRQD